MNGEILKRQAPGVPSPEVSAVRPALRSDAREPLRDPVRLKRRITNTTDRFAIDDSLTPEGFTREWKRFSVAGKEDDDNAFYQAGMRANHWEPVMAEDNPGVAPHGKTSGAITNGALMLMQRPTYLCEEARDEEMRASRAKLDAQKSAIADAPAGTFTRNHPGIAPMIRKTNETEAA